MAEDHKLQYAAVFPQCKKEISLIYKDYRITQHIEDLYELIRYQQKLIQEQRQQIIADKHQEAWKQYYTIIDEYNLEKRRYYTQDELNARKY